MAKEDYNYYRFTLSLSKADSGQRKLAEMLLKMRPRERNHNIVEQLLAAYRIQRDNPFADRDALLDRAAVTEEYIDRLAQKELDERERKKKTVNDDKKAEKAPQPLTSTEKADKKDKETDETIPQSAMDFLASGGFM